MIVDASPVKYITTDRKYLDGSELPTHGSLNTNGMTERLSVEKNGKVSLCLCN